MAVRSESSRQAILDATLDLLIRDRQRATTVQKLTIEKIAKRAKVSRATIYRWWPSKAAVVIDAFMEGHLPQVRIPEDLPFREATETHVKALIARYAGPQGRLVAQIIAEGQYDPMTLNDFKTRFWNDRYTAVEKLMQRGIDEGVLRSDIEPGFAAELIYAPIYLHLLFGLAPLDDALAEGIVDRAIRGLAADGAVD